jgi:hypothetical protein
MSVTSLGNTPDPINSPDSRGNAVADNGTVVGWYGIYPFATSSFTNDINLANGPSLLSTFDFSTWLPKPFVWTMASDTMTSLGTTPVNNPATTYTYGAGDHPRWHRRRGLARQLEFEF